MKPVRPSIQALSSLSLSLSLVASTALADRPLSSSEMTRSPECTGRRTVLSAERTSEYRQDSSRDRGDRAEDYLSRGGRSSLCGRSDRRKRDEYAAQAILSADLLSQTKARVLAAVDQTKAALDRQAVCVRDAACYRRQTTELPSFVDGTVSQFKAMRLQLAVSQVRASCVSSSKVADRTSSVTAIEGCMRNVRLAHPAPFWARAGASLGVTSRQFEENLQPLTAGEIRTAAEWLYQNTPPQGRGVEAAVTALQRQAEQRYRSMFIDNPMLRYLRSIEPSHEEFRSAFERTLTDVSDARRQVEASPLRAFRAYPTAMRAALRDVPERFRGDYCEIAHHLVREQEILEEGRTALMVGAALLPLGLPMALARGTNALLALATGGNFVSSASDYRARVRECVDRSVCSPEEVERAASVMELDYLAVGLTGAGASARAMARFLARNPDAARRAEELVATRGRREASQTIDAVAREACAVAAVPSPALKFGPFSVAAIASIPFYAWGCDASHMAALSAGAAAGRAPVASSTRAGGREIRATAEEIRRLESADGGMLFSSGDISTLASVDSDRRVTAIIRDSSGRERRETLTRQQILERSERGEFLSFRIEGVEPRPAAVLTAEARSRIDPELARSLGDYDARTVHRVTIEFESGQVASFSGNRDMVEALARDPSVRRVAVGVEPSWIPPAHSVSAADRAGADSVIERMRAEIRASAIAREGRSVDLRGAQVFHGTIREMEESVRSGPLNVGSGFGGRGLYLANGDQRGLADGFAHLAAQAPEARVSSVRAVAAGERLDRQPITLSGRFNPDRQLRVGAFTVSRDAYEPDFARGILPSNWAEDPRLRRLLEEEFDVLEVRGARSSGLAIGSDSFWVVHQRAGRDAIIWEQTLTPARGATTH